MLLALVNGVVDQERLEEIAADIADAVSRNVIDKELDFLEVGEAAAVVVGNGAE